MTGGTRIGNFFKRDLIPARYVLAAVAFLGYLNAYCLRFDLSIALVAMVNRTATVSKKHSDGFNLVCNITSPSYAGNEIHGTYHWSPSLQGFVQSSFFYGYFIAQMPGGILAQKFGGKILFGIGNLITSLLTFLIPWAADYNVYSLVAIRIIMGMAEGLSFPGMHRLWGEWAPPLERSKLTTFVSSGSFLGAVVVMLLSGYLSKHGFAGGWPSIFYVFGMFGCAWFVLWMLLVWETPAAHPRISQSERRYIEESLGESLIKKTDPQPPIPWREIIRSTPVWALNALTFANMWIFYTLLTFLPTYLKVILKLDIEENGVFSALPYLAMTFTANISGVFADYFQRNHMDRTKVRKIVTTAGVIPSVLFLLAANWSGCDKTLAVTFFTLSVASIGLYQGGVGAVHLDMAPVFSGALYGFLNTFSSLSGIIAPALAGFLTEKHFITVRAVGVGRSRDMLLKPWWAHGIFVYFEEKESWTSWQQVFYISTGIQLVGLAIFLMFGRGEVQKWGIGKDYEAIEDSKPETEMKTMKSIREENELDD